MTSFSQLVKGETCILARLVKVGPFNLVSLFIQSEYAGFLLENQFKTAFQPWERILCDKEYHESVQISYYIVVMHLLACGDVRAKRHSNVLSQPKHLYKTILQSV